MIQVPENCLVTICEDRRYEPSIDLVVQPLKGKTQRRWFIPHAYFCLPLVIGNQYGFAIRSLKDFSVIWNGKNNKEDILVKIMDHGKHPGYQSISSHFGMGTVTI